MTTHIIGIPAYHNGQVVDLEDRIAKAWFEEGYCVPLQPGDEANVGNVVKAPPPSAKA
jgi:hypothetical protein